MRRCVILLITMGRSDIQPLRKAFGEHGNTQLYFADTRVDKDVLPLLTHAVST